MSLARCDWIRQERIAECLKRFMQISSRYQRGNRSLAANLSMSQSNTVAVTPEEQEEDYDIPEEVETVIG